MRNRSPLLVAFALVSVAVVVACSSAATDAPQTGDAAASAVDEHEASTVDSPAAATDAMADGGAQQVPADCEEVTLTAAPDSVQKTNPEEYLSQPYLIGVPKLGGSTGNPQQPNKFFFWLDSANAVGSYPITPLQTYVYDAANTGGISADFIAPDASDGGAGGFTKRYIAVSGTVQMTSVLTPHQTEGTVSNVRFEEVKRNDDGTATLVPGGKCYWLKSTSWNTKRAGGCAPFTTNTCGAGKFCMPTNAIGDDGLCVTTGTKPIGAVCTQAVAGNWDSDCVAGSRCAKFAGDFGETKFTCHKLCDVRSTAPDCPADAHCGGGYNTCMSVAFLKNAPVNGNEIDTVATVGQTCAQNPKANYCGVSSKPGICYTDTGAAGATCRPFVHALSECPAGTTGGYVGYKGGIDQSTVWCFE